MVNSNFISIASYGGGAITTINPSSGTADELAECNGIVFSKTMDHNTPLMLYMALRYGIATDLWGTNNAYTCFIILCTGVNTTNKVYASESRNVTISKNKIDLGTVVGNSTTDSNFHTAYIDGMLPVDAPHAGKNPGNNYLLYSIAITL